MPIRSVVTPPAALPVQRPPASHAPHGSPNGDHRRTLHLSLGGAPHGNGGTPPAEHHPAERHNSASEGQPAQHHAPHTKPPANPQQRRRAPNCTTTRTRPALSATTAERVAFSGARSAAFPGPVQPTDTDLAQRKEGAGSYIDKDLRARVDGDIVAFLKAFDAALIEDTQESRSALREATDRLLRAGARTRIELERLEARTPLTPRDNIGRSEPAWRHR